MTVLEHHRHFCAAQFFGGLLAENRRLRGERKTRQQEQEYWERTVQCKGLLAIKGEGTCTYFSVERISASMLSKTSSAIF